MSSLTTGWFIEMFRMRVCFSKSFPPCSACRADLPLEDLLVPTRPCHDIFFLRKIYPRNMVGGDPAAMGAVRFLLVGLAVDESNLLNPKTS